MVALLDTGLLKAMKQQWLVDRINAPAEIFNEVVTVIDDAAIE